MPVETITRLLGRLEELKRPAGEKEQARLIATLNQLARRRFTDAASLVRFHETLLFMRAYPQRARLLRQTEAILKNFSVRVEALWNAGADMQLFSDPEVSGIVGTSMAAIFSYAIARWLARRHAAEVSIDWEGYEDSARLGQTLPRFVPLLEEEALVEANVPFLEWLRTARGAEKRELSWLIERFESLPLSDRAKAELYDSLKLYITWEPHRTYVTRTCMKLKTREIFYHPEPLVSRREVSLAAELNSKPLPVKKLSRREGEEILELVRATSAIRYRELHGFTFGDAAHVWRVEAGRGVEFFLNGVAPENRLPLRAYHSALMVKNGVPVGYVEGISLFERMEIGFNIYYTFREGESAWLYARALKLFRQLLGVTAFSVDPYQIGFENEEGIESGAFWFYRKLGFRPVRAEIEKLVSAEELKLAARAVGYRTNAKTLRQMAVGHLLFEFSPTARRAWDDFHMRHLGLAVGRHLAKNFKGDAQKMRRASTHQVASALGLKTKGWKETELCAFENLALMLSLIPSLSRWTKDEKQALVRIVRAKAGREESSYLRLLQKHSRLRDEIIRLGSAK